MNVKVMKFGPKCTQKYKRDSIDGRNAVRQTSTDQSIRQLTPHSSFPAGNSQTIGEPLESTVQPASIELPRISQTSGRLERIVRERYSQNQRKRFNRNGQSEEYLFRKKRHRQIDDQ
ncbi:hypothetical protein U1Q18_051826 [Sarracenia purpurea var. burkii]